MMAAFIDLNPVRAGLVADAEDYRWSGYGEAAAGDGGSREGIANVVGVLSCAGDRLVAQRWREVATRYRVLLGGTGGDGDTVERGEGDQAKVQGGLSVLGRRVRYFGDALVMGSEGFVEAVFEKIRGKLGLRRMVGARKARDIDFGSLRVMRDLRGEVVG